MSDKSLIYVSEATQAFGEVALRELADLAWHRNQEVGVTGYLHFSKGRFTQYIEGEATTLENLFASIQRDSRHRVLAVAEEGETTERRFPQWGMRWVRDEEVQEIQLETILGDHLVLARQIEHVTDYQRPLWRIVAALASAYRNGFGAAKD